MKINQQKFCLEYCTAPSLAGMPDDTPMLPIQLQVPHGSAPDAAKLRDQLLSGNLQCLHPQDFRKHLPAVLEGSSDIWRLWLIRILPQRLQLTFMRLYPLAEESPHSFSDGFANGNMLHCATLNLVAPTNLACDFIVPAMQNDPERCIRYNFACRSAVGGDPHEICDLRVTEVVNGQVQFVYHLKTPYCRPQTNPEPQS